MESGLAVSNQWAVARKCSLKVIASALAIAVIVWGVCFAIQHAQDIGFVAGKVGAALVAAWADLCWAASFGDRFWGAIATGSFALSVAAWAGCVLFHLHPAKGRTLYVLIGVIIGSLFLWVLAAPAAHALDPSQLSTAIQTGAALVVFTIPTIISIAAISLGFLCALVVKPELTILVFVLFMIACFCGGSR